MKQQASDLTVVRPLPPKAQGRPGIALAFLKHMHNYRDKGSASNPNIIRVDALIDSAAWFRDVPGVVAACELLLNSPGVDGDDQMNRELSGVVFHNVQNAFALLTKRSIQ